MEICLGSELLTSLSPYLLEASYLQVVGTAQILDIVFLPSLNYVIVEG